MINLPKSYPTPALQLALCTLLDSSLAQATKLIPLLQPNLLDTDDRDKLIVQVHAAQRDLETLSRSLAEHLPTTTQKH